MWAIDFELSREGHLSWTTAPLRKPLSIRNILNYMNFITGFQAFGLFERRAFCPPLAQ